MSIEDPVEFTIEGVNQIEINNKTGLTFSEGLKGILRQDIDIAMIGEMRDEDTVNIAIRAAETGHLILSTLHTVDAVTFYSKTYRYGFTKVFNCRYVNGSYSSKACTEHLFELQKSYYPSKSEKDNLELAEDVVLYKGEGCDKCKETGFKGRKAIFELMEVDDTHRRLIMEKDNVRKIREYNKMQNMITLKDACKHMVIGGVTTYDEMLRTIYFNV